MAERHHMEMKSALMKEHMHMWSNFLIVKFVTNFVIQAAENVL